MSPENRALLAVAVMYPFASLALLRLFSGVSGIPRLGDWVLFVFVFPILAAVTAIAIKLRGARLAWGSVAGFAAWMGVVGWCHHWLITGIWAVI